MEAWCSKCQSHKPMEEFHKDSSSSRGCAYYCKVCACENGRRHHRRRMKEDTEYKLSKRKAYTKSAHGITLEEYENKLRLQGNLCAICEVELQPSGHKTHLDHCHKTGELRAFLCTNCNRGLGHFQDSVTLLAKAAEYLTHHRGECSSPEGG